MLSLLLANASLMPPAAAEGARSTDHLLFFILGVGGVAYVAIMILMFFFVIKYRHRPGVPSKVDRNITHNTKLEVAWTLIPLGIMLVMFGWGYRNYMRMQTIPTDALEINVTGQKWSWEFKYPSGATGTKELAVPQGRAVVFNVTARDVMHSLFFPAFRAKVDAVPNRYNAFAITPTEVGEYDGFCTEYCGTGHSSMHVILKVLPPDQFAAWEQAHISRAATPEARGAERVARDCTSCHSVEAGKPGPIGPSLYGLVGREEKFTDGSTLKITDENLYDYVRESTLTPQKRIVAGYGPTMNSFQGILVKPGPNGKEDDSELRDIVAYLRSLRPKQ